jgi:hypothetical protein
MISRLIYLVLGIIEGIIALRFIFRLLGANPESGFVNLIYNLSTPLVTPFAGIFGQDATVTGTGAVTTSVLDWTAVVAFVVYGIVLAIIGGIAARRY